MTHPLAPGQRLPVGTAPLTSASPLAAAGIVADGIIDHLGGTARMISAEVVLTRPGTEPMTGTAIVTAVLPEGDNTLRAEVTALLGDESTGAATLRFAFVLATADQVPGLLCPASRDWNEELHGRLAADEQFARLTESYDGTIGLSLGGRPVHVRCYRGQILEVVPRALRGADFVLTIPGDVFIDLMTAENNTFMKTAMAGRMTSAGSGYEYLRMTSALIRIIDHARDIAGSAGYVGARATSCETSTVA